VHGQALDFAALCTRFHLEPPRTIEVSADDSLNSFSPMRLRRLPLLRLSDTQLSTVLNRALLIHHPVFLYDVLTQVLSRPACLEKVNLARTYWTLAELCRARGRHDEALSWVVKGRAAAESTDKESLFEARLEWTMREFAFRLEDPEDPDLDSLLKHIWEYFVPKLPRLAEHLTGLLESAGLRPPLEAESVVAANAGFGSTTEAGIWTPGAAPTGQGSDKKLWLPGQE